MIQLHLNLPASAFSAAVRTFLQGGDRFDVSPFQTTPKELMEEVNREDEETPKAIS